jgi:prepilin-type N-terminal cleavage/methylation domain-containing protein
MSPVQNKKGSTLIEVLISIAILAITFVIFQATINAVFLNRESQHRELALRAAQTEIDNLRSVSFANIPTSSSFSNSMLNSLPQSQAIRTVTTINSTTKQLGITVSWREPTANNTSTVNLTTIITQSGL